MDIVLRYQITIPDDVITILEPSYAYIVKLPALLMDQELHLDSAGFSVEPVGVSSSTAVLEGIK